MLFLNQNYVINNEQKYISETRDNKKSNRKPVHISQNIRMASMLRLLLVSRHSRQPLLKPAQMLTASDGIFVRTLLGHSFPYIEKYTNKRDEYREKFFKNLGK